MRPDGNGSEITEAIGVRVTGHGRELTPGQIFGVEKVRRGNRRVLRENTEEVRAGGGWKQGLAEAN